MFLRGFGVPFWAWARVFGQGPRYGYRLELSLGRNRSVGATLRRAELPEHLLADEHHPPRDGDNGGWRSPAERRNQHRYHDNWLQNLLVSASLAGYRR